MSNPRIEKVKSVEDRQLPVFAEFDKVMEKIRKRAFEMFSEHGVKHGRDFDDWLAAEREVCWPSAELAETDNTFEIRVALPGFDRSNVTITANPKEMLVKALRDEQEESKDEKKNVHWSDFEKSEVLRHIELPDSIDVEQVKATMKDGLLTVVAKKAAEKPASKVVEVSSAA